MSDRAATTKPDECGPVLGSVTQAAERYDVDAAQIWEMVADGELVAWRDDNSATWTIAMAQP